MGRYIFKILQFLAMHRIFHIQDFEQKVMFKVYLTMKGRIFLCSYHSLENRDWRYVKGFFKIGNQKRRRATLIKGATRQKSERVCFRKKSLYTFLTEVVDWWLDDNKNFLSFLIVQRASKNCSHWISNNSLYWYDTVSLETLSANP